MRKFLVIATALTLCVALGASFAVAKTKKVDTDVSINFANGNSTDPYQPNTQDAFSGALKAKKGCKKNREVNLKGPVSGSDKSSSSGKYRITVGNAPAGTYKAVAAKKVIKKGNGNKVVCKKGSSDSITVQ